MNVIIPVAGVGKRMRPHTYSIPKVLLKVADKPLLGHILDKIKKLEVNEVIFIVGYRGEKIKQYVSENYKFSAIYIEQKEQLGLGHAVWVAREVVKDEPCVIIYGDTIFDGNIPLSMEVDGMIGVKTVEDPSRLGVVEVDGPFIKKFVEKPQHPVSNLAIVGVNFIRNSNLLFEHLTRIINKGQRTAGEFQLTDAFESMLKAGAMFKWFTIDNWYDCGTLDALLSTNRELLASTNLQVASNKYKGSVIIPPVFIHNFARIEHSIIGANVSINKDSYIRDSMISDSIINEGAVIESSRLEHSIIGANAVVKGVSGSLNIGELCKVILS